MKLTFWQMGRSSLARRWGAQMAGVALLPVALLAGWFALRGALTPATGAVLGLAATIAAALALLLGALQGRWVLERLAALRTFAGDLAREKFPLALPASGKDDYTPVAEAFNELARHLGLRSAVQRTLAQMDDALFNKPDVRILVRGALRCLVTVTRAELAVLALFEPESDETLTLYVMQPGEHANIETVRVELDEEHRRRLPSALATATSPRSPFPEAFTERLRRQEGVGHFFCVPVSRGTRTWGHLISCHAAPLQIKGGRAKLLAGAVQRLIAGFRNAERDRTIHSLAFVDRLTGLPNRTAFESVLAQRIAAARQDRTLVAVLRVDLDRFKQVNDAYGHALGDHLLVEVRRRIQIHLIQDDVAARVGGDEFALVLSHVTSPRDTALVARKLIRSLSRAFNISGNTIYTGASVGIGLFRGDRDGEADLMKMAESAMYRAKEAGRNRLAFYEPQMNADSRRLSQLDAELRNALKRNELVLHYQPQIDLGTGALAGVEALLRWQHPVLGLLPPGHFIGDAETIGLIPEIGAWVMREACLQHRRWREAGLDIPRVSVNVSNGQLPRSNFVASVREITEATAMPKGALEIEITETMLVEGGKAAMEALNQLAADGILIAIDDFGTGYSSFSYLRVMPARVLKLDMSFIVDLNVDGSTAKIVAAIINMAHALQKQVVAEGIERADQLQMLQDLGCDRGQGYLLGRPAAAADIARAFGRQRDFRVPPPAGALPAEWTLPPMPEPATLPVRAPAGVDPKKAPRLPPAPPVSDPWNDDMLEEPLTVPRFLDDDYPGLGGR